jgi:NlpC/P60 family putative phage cell wall peptidase
MCDRIVEATRAWIGTPYLHQASLRGAGADCLGLLRGVWREVIGHEPEAVPPYSPDWAEPSRTEALWQAAGRWLTAKPVLCAAPGDVLLFRMRAGGIAKHLGIQTAVADRASFVHSYAPHGVVESPLSLPWQRRIAARFSFPSGA